MAALSSKLSVDRWMQLNYLAYTGAFFKLTSSIPLYLQPAQVLLHIFQGAKTGFIWFTDIISNTLILSRLWTLSSRSSSAWGALLYLSSFNMPHDLNCKSSDPANGEATVPCLLMSLKHKPVRMQGIVMWAVMLCCSKVALAVSHVFKEKNGINVDVCCEGKFQ